jgi:VanZ family protein
MDERLVVTRIIARLEQTRHLWVVAGYVGFLLIVALSLVPATLRPHTVAGGEYEHVIAYALVGSAFGLGYREARWQLLSGLALTAGAASLELLQNFIPGRSPEAIGFIASSLGAWFGLGLSMTVLVVLRAAAR